MTERLPPMPEPLTPEERALAMRLARLGQHGEPSPALDARILAAARAEVPAAANPPRKPARWPLALGIAASVALAVGLAWQLRPLPAPVAYDEAASAVGVAATSPAAEAQAVDAMAAPDPAPPVAVPAEPPPAADDDAPHAFQRSAEPARQAAPKPGTHDAGEAHAEARQERSLRAPPAPPAAVVLQAPPTAGVESGTAAAADMALPAPPPAAPAAAAAKAAAPTPQATAREAAAREAAAERRPRNTTATSATESRAAAEDTFVDEPFAEDVPPATADSPAVRDAWLHRIRELQAAGDTEAARTSLREFVRRYPAFPLPDDLRPLLD